MVLRVLIGGQGGEVNARNIRTNLLRGSFKLCRLDNWNQMTDYMVRAVVMVH